MCEWLASLQRPINVRLVKGAYWDGEVKRAQQLGMPDYPVFTRKAATDLSYVACARVLLRAPTIYPAFATHNCRTVATILELANDDEFEFQKLFGMGDALYDALLAEHPRVACRIYAPVGGFTDLLPYLVRRLLENGANTSFVHQIADPRVPLETLVADPLAGAARSPTSPIRASRCRATCIRTAAIRWAWILSDREVLDELQRQTAASPPLTPVEDTSPQELDFSIARAADAFESWSQASAEQRAQLIERAADRLEAHMVELVSLIVREGGRTYGDAVAEVREAADFCRYYAVAGEKRISARRPVAGPRRRTQRAQRSTAAACSPASARGISRSPSSPARSPPRSPRATP